jgi:hypothetical protein
MSRGGIHGTRSSLEVCVGAYDQDSGLLMAERGACMIKIHNWEACMCGRMTREVYVGLNGRESYFHSR